MENETTPKGDDIGYCVACNAAVSIRETRKLGRCPACGDDFPMLMDKPNIGGNV
jgi:predicted RNA-binding Zn-ribbon protein involved in translation (DUF1610 family)